jgi:hypothetical protein
MLLEDSFARYPAAALELRSYASKAYLPGTARTVIKKAVPQVGGARIALRASLNTFTGPNRSRWGTPFLIWPGFTGPSISISLKTPRKPHGGARLARPSCEFPMGWLPSDRCRRQMAVFVSTGAFSEARSWTDTKFILFLLLLLRCRDSNY